jgi:hypothetical protein
MSSKTAASDSADIKIPADEIDRRRRAAAAAIKSAAQSLDEKADDLPGGARVAEIAHGAANKLNSTANYIRRRNLSAMSRDVRKVVRDNPVPALIGAAALGFLLAKIFASRD